VRLVACPEAEAGGKVAGEEMLLLDGGQKGLVDGLLVGGASTGDLLLLSYCQYDTLLIPDSSATHLGLLSLLEESLLSLLLLSLLLGEVVGSRDLLEGSRVDTLEVDLAAGSDHIAGVHSSERDTVDLKGAGNEEDTLGEVLEENNALATETTSEENQDGTRLEALTGLGGADGLADLYR
jgi:hypothetical protein